MRLVKERRRATAWKLRIYVGTIKEVEAMTDEQWVNQWIRGCDADTPFMLRSTWISILKGWALKEAEALATENAA